MYINIVLVFVIILIIPSKLVICIMTHVYNYKYYSLLILIHSICNLVIMYINYIVLVFVTYALIGNLVICIMTYMYVCVLLFYSPEG